MKYLFMLIAATFFTGCATYKPVPDGYTGPLATISDSGQRESGTKAQLFALTDIDGNRIMNSFWASARASQGQGFALAVVISDRQIPAKPMKATLKASHTTAAPIQAIASQMAGTFFSAEGIVDFTPKPDGKYVVRGELKKNDSSVWIEDVETGQAVTERIVSR